MEKNKIEKFTNFNYKIVPNKEGHYVDVKCSFKYEGRSIEHFVSFTKQGDGNTNRYIDLAKKKIESMKANGELEKVAKKYINKTSPSFFKRYKKPLIIAGAAVLVAGVAIGATFATLNYINSNNQTKVTEAEIDRHLLPPQHGSLVSTIDEELIGGILQDAISTIGGSAGSSYYFKADGTIGNISNLKSAVMKSMSTGDSVSNPYGSSLPRIVEFNDTTEYYSNQSFRMKQLNSMYTKIDIKNDPIFISSNIISNIDEVVESRQTHTNVTSKNYFTHKKDSDGNEVAFEVGTTTTGDLTSKLNSIMFPFDSTKLNKSASYNDCEDFMDQFLIHQTSQLADLNLGLFEGGAYFYTLGDNDFYAICLPYIESLTLPSIYCQDGVMGYRRHTAIWHFTKNKNFVVKGRSEGWTLESYAYDDSAYCDYNDRYQKLSKTITVDKQKGFIEFKYGKRSSAKDDIKKLEVPKLEEYEVMSPTISCDEIGLEIYDTDEFDVESEYFSYYDCTDATLAYRLMGNKGYAITTSFYVPSKEEIIEERGEDMDLYSALYFYSDDYFEENDYSNFWDYYYVTDYSGISDKEKEYVEIVTDQKIYDKNWPCLKFTDKAKGHYFNLTVTYDTDILSFRTKANESDKLPENSILEPSNIQISFVR